MTGSRNRGWIGPALAAPLHRMMVWYRVAQERAALRELPAHRLDDLGLSRRDALCEAQRPFWR